MEKYNVVSPCMRFHSSSKRLKVLLCCYACDPYRGSEPGTGWHFLRLIARVHDVHVIVEQKKFQEPLERYSREHPDEVRNITFHFIRKPAHKLLRKIWPPSYYWFYRQWQKKAYDLAKTLHEHEHFDLTHYVNMVGYREPGYFWKLPVPFIWGPIGGLNHTEWCLLPCFGVRGALYYAGRNILNAFQKRFSQAAWIVSQRAHTILVTDPEMIPVIERIWHRRALLMREVGVDVPAPDGEIPRRKKGEPLRVCWCGVHEPRKGLNLLLHALPHCKSPIEVYVLGKGSCTEAWKRLASQLGMEKNVHFLGKVPHCEVFPVMKNCHVFAFPSLSEGGTPNVVMEALQLGLPVICLNHCAFASVVNESCGIKIPITNRAQIIRDFANHLDYLNDDEDARLRLAYGAQKRSMDFLWENCIDRIDKVYRQAVSDTNGISQSD